MMTRRPSFSATLIHGSIRLTAAMSPLRSAFTRSSCVPAFTHLIWSRVKKPSSIFSMVKCEPLNGLTAIGLFLSCSGS